MTTRSEHITKAFSWMIGILAYAYLAYVLLSFKDYPLLLNAIKTQLSGFDSRLMALALAILLFPLNQFLEAWKWRYLLRSVVSMSMAEAQKQVYYANLASFITPARVGDYPARVLRFEDKSCWMEAVVLGLVGSVALLAVIVCLGMPACGFYLFSVGDIAHSSLYIGAVFVVLTALLVGLSPWLLRVLSRRSFHSEQVRRTIDVMRTFSWHQFFYLLFQSLCRYFVWALQLWLLLYFCGVSLSFADAFIAIATYYLLVSVTPSPPAADAAVRGSWAVIIFSSYGASEPAIVIASLLIWIINTLFPLVVGSFFHPRKEVGE